MLLDLVTIYVRALWDTKSDVTMKNVLKCVCREITAQCYEILAVHCGKGEISSKQSKVFHSAV